MKSKKTSRHSGKFSFAGSDAKTIELDPAQKHLLTIQCHDDQFLAVAWEIDDSGYGYWRIRQVGVGDAGKIIKKELKPGKPAAAFYGEAAVVGAGGNDLFTSYGYEDRDQHDAEGNVVNKIQEVRIFPKRDD